MAQSEADTGMDASVVYNLISKSKAGDLSDYFSLFAYEGFNPDMVHKHFASVLADSKISNAEFIDDMRALITLGAMKGNYTMRNAGKISEKGRVKADELYKKYSLKQGSLGTDKKAITLPRVLSAFPELTTKVILKAPPRNFGPHTTFLPNIMKNPVFPSLIPYAIGDLAAATLLYLYNVYSAEQATVISQTKDIGNAFTAQKQFITIAYNSSVPPQPIRVATMKLAIDDLVKAVADGQNLNIGSPPRNRISPDGLRTAIESLP